MFPLVRLQIDTKDGLRIDISDPAVLSKAQQYMLDVTPELGIVGYAPLMRWIKARVCPCIHTDATATPAQLRCACACVRVCAFAAHAS